MLARLHGLGADHVQGMTIVTATGEVVEANAAENADLFWFARGGGGEFFPGIVLSVNVSLVEVPTRVTSINWQWDRPNAPAVLQYWQSAAAYAIVWWFLGVLYVFARGVVLERTPTVHLEDGIPAVRTYTHAPTHAQAPRNREHT